MDLLLDFLLPKTCIYCDDFGTYICSSCSTQLLQEEESEAVEISSGLMVDIHFGFCYNRAIELLWEYGKHQGYFQLCFVAGTILKAKLLDAQANKPPVIDWERDIFAPVPIFAGKKAVRGFNQVELMILGMALTPTPLLTRVKDTKTQVGMNQNQRKDNLDSAFALNWQAKVLKTRKIWLVDDIYTTGSTMRECLGVLHASGYKNIGVLMFAKA
ncbi:MAG: ComF family protein [Candidatus Dojkabacteria bacterium]